MIPWMMWIGFTQLWTPYRDVMKIPCHALRGCWRVKLLSLPVSAITALLLVWSLSILSSQLNKSNGVYNQITLKRTFPITSTVGKLPAREPTGTSNNNCDPLGSRNSLPSVFIMVHSACINKPLRDAIRGTWGVKRRVRKHGLHLVFVLGSCEQDQAPKVGHEARLYRDIVILNVTEDYRALTMKSIATLEWTQQCATHVDYIVKCDDDAYVKVKSLSRYISSLQGAGIWGHVNRNASVMRKGLWRISKTDYARDTYPPYTSGNLYVISNGVIGSLLECYKHHIGLSSQRKDSSYRNKVVRMKHPILSNNSDMESRGAKSNHQLPYVPFEDVYVTGILSQCAGISINHNSRFPSWLSGPSRGNLQLLVTDQLLGLHGVDYARMYEIHNMVTQCDDCRNNATSLNSWFERIKKTDPFL